MSRLIERIFDPSRPLVVRRFFAAAGRHFNPGDPFDWRRYAVDQRRVRLMFEAGKLMHPEPTFAEHARLSQPVIEVAAVGAILSPAPSIEQEMQDEDIAATSTPLDDAVLIDDGLDALNMRELRDIAAAEGAPTRLRRADQREAIREHRRSAPSR